MAANIEYLGVLSQVVSCIRKALRDERLPDLTPEQLTEWLHSMTVADVRAVWEQHDGDPVK